MLIVIFILVRVEFVWNLCDVGRTGEKEGEMGEIETLWTRYSLANRP